MSERRPDDVPIEAAEIAELQRALEPLRYAPDEGQRTSLLDAMQAAHAPQSATLAGERAGRRRRRWVWPLALAAAAAAAVVVVVALVVGRSPRQPPVRGRGWPVQRLAGTPRVGGKAIVDRAALGVGQWLETDGGSRARLVVANIGRLAVSPDTRLQLLRSGAREHRLRLQRGTIHARVTAPPRLFVVETPSAQAVDLGCAYTLAVDARGGATLTVTSGAVALEHGKRSAFVPVGARCETRRGHGPGTPYAVGASSKLVSALRRFDFDSGGAAALRETLDAARAADSLTLWHLVGRADEAGRAAVVRRARALGIALPAGVEAESLVRGDRRALSRWRTLLEPLWQTRGHQRLRRK